MKIELQIDPSLPETTVLIRAPARTEAVEALLDRLTAAEGPLLGFQDSQAVPLNPEDVLRFYGEDKAVLAQTVQGTWTVRKRLYELEQRLEGHRFVRSPTRKS